MLFSKESPVVKAEKSKFGQSIIQRVSKLISVCT